MTKRKAPGNVVELGDTLGWPTEPERKYGRIVGIRKDDCRAMEQFVIRKFQDGDGWFPTGEYRTTWFVVPYGGEL